MPCGLLDPPRCSGCPSPGTFDPASDRGPAGGKWRAELARDLLFDDSITLDMDSVLGDLPNFDSMMYVSFIVTAEMKLGVKYRVADVEAFETVGDIVAETQALLQRSAG